MPEQKLKLPDDGERELIVHALDRNLLVEAAAGTGKTTGMVSRMVELIATGGCTVERMAAVTFTRKAAGELRSRFREELEDRFESGAEQGERAEHIARALEQPSLGFVGTIHSFCARLLRERPVEAGIDPDFREVEEEEDEQRRGEAWQEFIARCIAAGDPGLESLARTGIAVSELQNAYGGLCTYPDIADWPVPDGAEMPPAAELDSLLAPLVSRIKRTLSGLPADPGTDKLIPLYRQILRMYSQADPASGAELAEIVEACRPRKVTQKIWGDTQEAKKRAKQEGEDWAAFCERTVGPLLVRLRTARYAASLELLCRAAGFHRERRLAAGQLNFTDLLIFARDLLKNSPPARAYFGRRFSHLLVDEFQDTDPVQAEIMLLLTAENPDETDWTRCRPRPGALFVVGDPKQSIYRFRRADIITYNQVRRLIEGSGGRVVHLSSNFRTRPEVVDWINGRFAGSFPGGEYSPEYVALQAARQEAGGAVEQLWLDETGSENNTRVQAVEPKIVAAAVRDMLQAAGDGSLPNVLVLTWKKKNLDRYAAALERLGIPNQVTGSNALGSLPQVRLLWLAASAAANPEDPVALVALLRSEAFGFSDPELYAWVKGKCRFDYRETSRPEELAAEVISRYEQAFSRLKKYARWLETLPPVAALERVSSDLGLFAQAAGSRGGNQRAGGLSRALELVRGRERARDSLPEALEVLRRLAAGELDADSTEARPGIASPVRVMNLHKAKGLEADIVFLADPTGGERPRSAEVHVVRSGAASSGYLAISRPNPFGGTGKLLACHPDWPELEREESRFLDAERIRLLYVAATRARDRLVVSSREKDNYRNPWQVLFPALDRGHQLNFGNLDDHWQVTTPPSAGSLPPGGPPDIDSTWRAAGREGYAVAQAKRLALDGALAHPGAAGEHGTEWGRAVHLLLEFRAKNPGADLLLAAGNLLDREEYENIDIPAAVDTAASVLDSELWARAHAAEQVLAETPFELADKSGDGAPALVRGVVDLAFREQGGWVLADYKTDRGADKRLEELLEYYAPQLDIYAGAWKAATGEPVVEKGLYFTDPGIYKIVD